MESITVTRKRAVKVYHHFDPINPREWDNLGTMVCWHRGYDLGDEQPRCTPVEYLINLLYEADRRAHYVLDEAHNRGRDITDLLQAQVEKHFVVLPLYLYDHSGITMRTSAFSCPWDSGQVGFLFCSLDRARTETGYGHLEDDAFRAKVADMLEGEVDEYDAYLRGDCYGFTVVDELVDEDGEVVKSEVVDSCWGFLHTDAYPAIEGMREHVDESLHALLVEAFDNPEYLY